MNRCFGSYLLAVLGLMCCRTMADVTAVPLDPGISEAAKNDPNVAGHPDELAEIQQKVHEQVAKLAKNPSDPAIVSMTRLWLLNEMQLTGNPGDTAPGYELAYGSALNGEFSKLLSQPDTPVNTRLNIGIIIVQLHGRTESLAPSVVSLLQDKSSAVALWGEKAAGAILPVAVRDPAFVSGGLDQVLAAIIGAVAAHPDGYVGGLVAEEAYSAINPEQGWPRGLFPPPNALLALIGANLTLQQSRLEIYRTTGVPEAPRTDTYASYLLLGFPDVWKVMNADQQLQAVQQASDLISLAGQRAAGAGAGRIMNQNDELIDTLKGEGKWIMELSKILNPPDPDLEAVAGEVYRLTVATPPDKIHDACIAVYGALQHDFPTLPTPKQIDSAKSTTDKSSTTLPSEAQR
jgi:hypothetical protein